MPTRPKPNSHTNINGQTFLTSTLNKLGGLDNLPALAQQIAAREKHITHVALEANVHYETITKIFYALGYKIPRNTKYGPKLDDGQTPGEIARLRRLTQGVTATAETENPTFRRANQTQAAQHLGLTLDQYLQYETDQAPLPQPLWVQLLSLRPTRRVRLRPTRHKHHSHRNLPPQEADHA